MVYYFDHNATTPPSPEAMDELVRVSARIYGNPSSIHTPGQKAREVVESSRATVAALLGCDPKEIVFTSGGTEADNLALLGAIPSGEPRHAVISAIEHPAVLATPRELERRNVTVSIVPADANGIIQPDAVRKLMRPNTALVSVMHANNETGAIQPIREITEVAHEGGALMHSDGVQAAGRIPVDVRELGADLYSISGHKFYAPKGTGALYVRDGVRLRANQLGGRHERERRAGTENVPGIAAMAAAARWILTHRDSEAARLTALRDRLEHAALSRIPDACVNSAAAPRVPNTTNIAFRGLEGEALVIALDLAGFAVSTGAACSSGAVQPSHVLLAMGLTSAQAKSSIRFSLGRINTGEQVDSLVDALEASVTRLRRLSPVRTYA